MSHQLVHLFERTFVEQQIDALAGGEFPLFMLPFAPLFSTAGLCRGMAPPDFLKSVRKMDLLALY